MRTILKFQCVAQELFLFTNYKHDIAHFLVVPPVCLPVREMGNMSLVRSTTSIPFNTTGNDRKRMNINVSYFVGEILGGMFS